MKPVRSDDKVDALPALRFSGRLQSTSGAPKGVLRKGIVPQANIDTKYC